MENNGQTPQSATFIDPSDPKIPALPTRKALAEHRENNLVNGFLFPLTATSIGLPEPIMVRIRRLSMIDRAAIDQLPPHLKDVIFEGIKEFQAEQRKSQDGDNDPQDILEMMANNEKILNAADAWCRAAFIYPQVVAEEKDISGDNVWTVDDIHAEDRVAVLAIGLDSDSPQIKKLKSFRSARPVHVPDRTPLPVAEQTVPGVGSEG